MGFFMVVVFFSFLIDMLKAQTGKLSLFELKLIVSFGFLDFIAKM